MDKELLEAIGQMLEPVNTQLNRLAFNMDNEFAQIRDRLDKMDARMDNVEARIEHIDDRMNHTAASMKLMDGRMDKLGEGIDRIEDDIAIIKEDCEITRGAANELLEWSNEMSRAVSFPLPGLGEKIS